MTPAMQQAVAQAKALYQHCEQHGLAMGIVIEQHGVGSWVNAIARPPITRETSTVLALLTLLADNARLRRDAKNQPKSFPA